MPPTATQPKAVTGVQLMQGIGVVAAKPFWADAWSTVFKRPGAVAGLVWIGIIAFFAMFSPVLANGHPIVLRQVDASGATVSTTYPLVDFLSALDVALLLLGVIGIPAALLLPVATRSRRLSWLAAIFICGLVTIVTAALLQSAITSTSASPFFKSLRGKPWTPYAAAGVGLAITTLVLAVLPLSVPHRRRFLAFGVGGLFALLSVAATWNRPALESYDYQRRAEAGEVRATYTLVPFGPQQRFSELSRQPPGATLAQGLGLKPDQPGANHRFILGTDAFGSDVLSQVMHACRLSISIGLVSTGIALMIGVTLGALMGYFGGWVDLVLFRVVEIFMAVPVLFLLIVAVAVLPNEWRTTYTMMAIVGCFSWTGMARFTRSEFLKLRKQDFVQSAQALGLPLRSVLFKHMLPNGVAPVLVESSFAIAAAITIEAVLSYLNLGPIDQASWGKLLSSAVSQEGEFKWWLAVFPGVAIFLTVLSYNLVGEALRDAIDPKLKKARV